VSDLTLRCSCVNRC